ncbi:MAG: hypothetical protein AAGI37_07105 [Planctomycetota bacterium]
MDQADNDENPQAAVSDRDMLTQFLASRDVTCPACDYNIRHLQGGTCPECGRELVLQIGVVGISNVWITALVGALVPAGCGIPFHILLLYAFAHGAAVSDIVSEPEGVLFLILVFYALCCVVISILLLVMRQRFMRWRVQVQGGIASGLVMAAVFAGILGLALISNL